MPQYCGGLEACIIAKEDLIVHSLISLYGTGNCPPLWCMNLGDFSHFIGDKATQRKVIQCNSFDRTQAGTVSDNITEAVYVLYVWMDESMDGWMDGWMKNLQV